MSNKDFLMFVAHGERPLLTDEDYMTEEDLDNSVSQTSIDKVSIKDDNIYITFCDVGSELSQLPINIISYSLSSDYSKHQFKKIINTLKESPIVERSDKLQDLLFGIIFIGFVENLLKLGITCKKIDVDRIKSSYDWETIKKNDFIDISGCNEENFYNYTPKFNETINIFYNEIINFYKINEYLKIIDSGKFPNDDIFNILMFGENESLNNSRNILYFYKAIILIICSMMNASKQYYTINDTMFYSILSNTIIKEIFINYIDENTMKNPVINKVFNSSIIFFIYDICREFKSANNLYLKIYWKDRELPIYNYYINGYFGSTHRNIAKIGLRNLMDYYNLINNNIYNLSGEKLKMTIESLKTKCIINNICSEKDKQGRPTIIYSSIIYNKDNEDYIWKNWMFMFKGAIYPQEKDVDVELDIFNDESGEKQIAFQKGPIQNLKNLIENKTNIFGNDNIVLLFSCAVDYEDNNIPSHIQLTRQNSIKAQDYKKYLKYKNKYLTLKNKFNL